MKNNRMAGCRIAAGAAALLLSGAGLLGTTATADAATASVKCGGYDETGAKAAGYTTFYDVPFTNGTSGKDWIVGTTNSNDVLNGGSGDDIICSNGGADFLYGGPDKDTLFLGDDGATGEGDSGDDVIHGGGGPDTEYGDSPASGNGAPGDGNDVVWGGSEDDKLYGNGGVDTLKGGQATTTSPGDTGDGGDGNDTCISIETPTSC
jgi:Ca2+-binding RTX toxin-like protein